MAKPATGFRRRCVRINPPIKIAERSELAFHQDLLLLGNQLTEGRQRVGNVGGELGRVRAEVLQRCVHGGRWCIEAPEENVGKLNGRFQPLPQGGFAGQKFAHLEPHLGGFELIGLGDAPLRGAVLEGLGRLVQRLFDLAVERKNHVGAVGNDQFPGLRHGILQIRQLVDESLGIHHHAGPDDVHRVRGEHPRRKQVEYETCPGR